MAFCPYVITGVRRRRRGTSFVPKWGSRISREKFDLESPNFTRTFTQVGSNTTPDITSLTTSGRLSSKFKNPSKMPHQPASGGISRERFKRGSPIFTWLSGTTDPTNLLDMTSLIAYGRLQNAIKYCTKVVCKTGPTAKDSNNSATV